jgi:hypothetical protein
MVNPGGRHRSVARDTFSDTLFRADGCQQDGAGRHAYEMEAPRCVCGQQNACRRAVVGDGVGADAVARVRFVKDNV